MAWGPFLRISLILGIALYVTYVLTAIALGFVMPFLPLEMLGVFAGLVDVVLTILAMGIVGGLVLRYVK